MRILFAALHPPNGKNPIGGVQTWIVTLATYFQTIGHEVEVWGPELPLPGRRFDLGIFANTKKTMPAIDLCDQVLEFSHGIILAEKPSGKFPIAFTSEEVQDFWRLPGAIIRQPIDTNYWRDPIDFKGRGLVLYSYRCPDPSPFATLARQLGMSFSHLKKSTQGDIINTLCSAELVCASGRAALEALSCGTPTMIYDHRPYNGGAMLSPCLDVARHYNYSGRGPGRCSDLEVAHNAIAAGSEREYVLKWHKVSKIGREIIDACDFNTNRGKT